MITILLMLWLTVGIFTYFNWRDGWGCWEFPLGISITFALVYTCCLLPLYAGSKYKAEILNLKFGTDYTRYEIMFAQDLIEEIEQLQRHRTETKQVTLSEDQ